MMEGGDLTTEAIFESAVSIVRNLPKEGPIKPSDELKLKLYALYKQATHGPNDTAKPRFYRIIEAHKWDAWLSLGDMSKEEAMLSYIRELKQVMDNLPADAADGNEDRQLKDVLGAKFYQYWFGQWENSRAGERLESSVDSIYGAKESVKSSHSSIIKNDSRSNSSSNSSVSLLEEAQMEGDGYKTPTSSLNKESFKNLVSDQFAVAILRLQQGLEGTISRLDNLEDQMKHSIDRIRLLETVNGNKIIRGSLRPKSFLSILRAMEAFHWFYLTYPFVVYFILKATRGRRKDSATLSS